MHRPQDDAPEGLKHNPFAALRPKGAPAPVPPKVEPAPIAEPIAAAPGAKLVVGREKRGRAGKTVTRISGLALSPAAMDDIAGRLKRALGCGASVEDGDVILQGALIERSAAWLETHLKARVTRGN
jgi:translation initiation factor 1